MFIISSAKRFWVQPKVEGCVPSGRGVHTATVVKDQFVIFGGSAEYSQETLQCSRYYNNIYAINTGMSVNLVDCVYVWHCSVKIIIITIIRVQLYIAMNSVSYNIL